MTAAGVLENGARWGVDCADALAWLRGLPDDSIDLLITSPPYLEARTYGIAAGRKLEDWVRWMVELVTAASSKVKGLIAINCEGQTRDYRYLPAPFLLAADLHRAGFNLRKPVVFHRVGIPGSGGPDWLRNDWEPVVCVSRAGRLPWSCPTAHGKPPKHAVGGMPTSRKPDGRRVNREDTRITGGLGRPVVLQVGKKFRQVAVANPGNVLRCKVGGGLMGHPLAHENEAPFPLKLPEFFVQSFCPPDGIVCDPFAGSGTTCHAAILHGRRFIGCDIRESQTLLVARRMASVTPSLFGGSA